MRSAISFALFWKRHATIILAIFFSVDEITRLLQVEDAVVFRDKLLGYGVELVQSVVVQVAVTGRKDIAFAHFNCQLEQHLAQIFFKSAEHQLDILTDDG